MEKIYKNNNILFKIMPCLLIAMYAIMCLFGSYVCAANNEDIKTVYCELLDYNFELKGNIFNNNNVKYMLITSNQTYDKRDLVIFYFIVFALGFFIGGGKLEKIKEIFNNLSN